MNYHDRWDRPQFAPTTAAREVRLPLAPSLERRRMQANLGLLVLDGLALSFAFVCADVIYSGAFANPRTMLVLQLLLPLYWSAGLALGAYNKEALLLGANRRMRAATALGAAAVCLTFVTFMLKNTALVSRGTTMIGLALGMVLLIAGRTLAGPLINRFVGPTALNVLVIDDGGDPVRLPHAFHIDAREHGLSPDLNSPQLLDRIGLYMMNMDRVVVSCPRSRRRAWTMVFRSSNIQGEIFDRDVDELGVIGATRGHQFGALVVSSGVLALRSRIIKRLFDVTFAGMALIVLLPLLALTALAIMIEDGRPIFFVQKRVGRGNTFFPLIKFRSMRTERADAVGMRSASRDDDRCTRVGRIIRKLSIDELPQLVNVLLGQMSSGIGEIAIVQHEALLLDVRVLVDILDPAGVERRRPPLHAVDRVPLLEQQPREVGSVLAGGPGNESNFSAGCHGAGRPLRYCRCETPRTTARSGK